MLYLQTLKHTKLNLGFQKERYGKDKLIVKAKVMSRVISPGTKEKPCLETLHIYCRKFKKIRKSVNTLCYISYSNLGHILYRMWKEFTWGLTSFKMGKCEELRTDNIIAFSTI